MSVRMVSSLKISRGETQATISVIAEPPRESERSFVSDESR